ARPVSRYDRLPGRRHAAGDGDLERSRREGLGAILGPGPVGGTRMRQRAAASISLLFGLLTGTGEAVAQTPSAPEQVTVDQLVERAVADNPELRAMRAEVDAARGRLRQAALRPNPMLDLGGQQNVAGPDSNVSIGLSIPLDLNGRKAGRVGVAEREIEMKQAQVSERERRLAAEVSLKASELLAARRNFHFTVELL